MPLFLLSGGTALLYQVAFGKKLATIYGATAYAVSAVLAAFMGGLALGSHVGGRFAHRVRRPLVVYGVAEVLVGVVCALTPSMFDAIANVYRDLASSVPDSLVLLTALRALLTGGVVLVPTTAMGLTLPMLARALSHGSDARESSQRRLGILYAINTLGGAIGALASAYVVLPALGLAGTMRAAAAVNIAIGAVAVMAGWRDQPLPETDAGALVHEGGAGPGKTTLAFVAFASGLLVFAVEVVDTHLLALLIGNSAYAFGLMLAVFLTCLSVGAALAGALDRRLGEGSLSVALVTASLALSCSLPLFGQLPRIFLLAGGYVESWAGRELFRGLSAVLVLALPTTCMGLTFPLLLRHAARRSDVGSAVGRLTAINTLGSIAGSLLCGYAVLPWLGSELTLRLVAALFALFALAFAWRTIAVRRFVATASLAALACVWLLPRWDMRALTNGANIYFDAPRPPDEIVFVAEDVHGGLTTVARRGDVLTLYTNGKFQGDNGPEVTAQRSFAHFPAMFVHDFERALVIGLGTGTTLGTIAAYPFRKIEAAEISPAIVEAAARYFTEPNRGVLTDPRVKVILNDGRNLL
ncbi:MAG: spermidine synthase, partial [Myxococcales bacterium]|nr:spermidine synthase [Myxococcales bacterium]